MNGGSWTCSPLGCAVRPRWRRRGQSLTLGRRPSPLCPPRLKAVTTAKPFVDQALTFLTTTEPSLLAQYAVVAVTAWYLAPPLLRAGVDALRKSACPGAALPLPLRDATLC